MGFADMEGCRKTGAARFEGGDAESKEVWPSFLSLFWAFCANKLVEELFEYDISSSSEMGSSSRSRLSGMLFEVVFLFCAALENNALKSADFPFSLSNSGFRLDFSGLALGLLVIARDFRLREGRGCDCSESCLPFGDTKKLARLFLFGVTFGHGSLSSSSTSTMARFRRRPDCAITTRDACNWVLLRPALCQARALRLQGH